MAVYHLHVYPVGCCLPLLYSHWDEVREVANLIRRDGRPALIFGAPSDPDGARIGPWVQIPRPRHSSDEVRAWHR